MSNFKVGEQYKHEYEDLVIEITERKAGYVKFKVISGECWLGDNGFSIQCCFARSLKKIEKKSTECSPTDASYVEYLKTLKTIDEYDGLVYSLVDENKLISQEELADEVFNLLLTTDESPIVAVASTGEHFDMSGVYIHAMGKVRHRRKSEVQSHEN